MGKGGKDKRGKGKRGKGKSGKGKSGKGKLNKGAVDESNDECVIYEIADLNKILRSTMPTLDDFDDISCCRYCDKILTRGLATPRNDRPEVEHIIEVQAFIDVMREVYYAGDTKEDLEGLVMTTARMDDWISFVNSATNLVIACGECNMKKKVLQQEAIRHAKGGSLQDRDAYQPKDREPQWIALANKDKIEDLVNRALIGVAGAAFLVNLPMEHVRRLAVVTLSHWMCEYDSDYFLLWAENALSNATK